jgi:ketosteroid isomerase-like protein
MSSSPQAAPVTPESVIHRYFTAFQRHALDEMLELLDENARCTYPNEPQRNWHGRKAAEQVMRGYFSRLPDLKLEWRVEKAEPEPSSQAVAFYLRNHVSATGLEMHLHLKYVVSGGRITEIVHQG